MIVFVTGGVRSGKSDFAERRAISLFKENGSNLHYIATNQVYDKEMQERVNRHQQTREKSGANWIVWEQPRNIDELFSHFKKDDVLLLDCVTTLVSNELFSGWETNSEKWKNVVFQFEIEQNLKCLFSQLAAAPWHVVIVSNEVSYDGFASDEGTKVYKRLLGRLHRHIVLLAKEAIMVECGIPCWKKGGIRT